MTAFASLAERLHKAFEVPGLRLPIAGVRIYKEKDLFPPELDEYETQNVTVTSCQADRMAGIGEAVLLTRDNIGCVAAAITFGLVDENRKEPMEGPRLYTNIMKDHSDDPGHFRAPSPSDFTEGLVYACRDSGRKDFCLFGEGDTGRFVDRETAKKAVSQMSAIRPATTRAVFFFPPDFEEFEVEPDVVTLSLRPVELTRLVQGYQFLTGERVEGNMGPVRVVNSDLIVRPYLTGKINYASYCVGARLIAEFEADRLGAGMPYSAFRTVVDGVEKSKGGYPFPQYPGARDR